jgi:hypothetical protein
MNSFVGTLPPEDQFNEYKEYWSDNALKDACAFANSDDGGRITLGVTDAGEVVGFGWRDDAEQQAAVNKLCSLAGMARKPSVQIRMTDNRLIIVVDVRPDYHVVKYGGKAYTRVGSTSRVMTDMEERLLTMRRSSTWQRLARVLGIEHERVWGVNTCFLLLLGVSLVVAGIVSTTAIAAKYESFDRPVPFGQTVSWWAGTMAILIPSAIGIVAATQERLGWVRYVVLGLSLLMWALFVVDGYPEAVRLEITSAQP